jgi:hypothetical protein
MVDDIADAIGGIPYRLALCGGWIDQPFVSERNPAPPGSMTVVAVEPDFRFMDCAGLATSTRKVAARLWGKYLPDRPPDELVRELYAEENRDKADPSGSQDMVGLVYPGVVRMDFDVASEGGRFPVRVETCEDPGVVAWLERTIRIVPVAQRPPGYSPLGVRNLEPGWVRRLGESGRACFDAIVARDLGALQASMNECMLAWEALLPATLRHPLIQVDLVGLMDYYRKEFGGAMYSGCGGGYLFVASDRPVPGSVGFRVRTSRGPRERRGAGEKA